MAHSVAQAMQSKIAATVEADTNGGCWLWAGFLDKDGYGRLWDGQTTVQAHRAAYSAFNGPTGDALVLHRCDVAACCNPEHLFLGTHADNMADMVRKGRKGRKRSLKGEASPASKLTDADVQMIRSSSESSYRLAESLPVTPSMIRRIRREGAWNHVK